MRLTCPSCGAEYQVADEALPETGRHVQCSDCHTRWFARRRTRPALVEPAATGRIETFSGRPPAGPALVERPAAEAPSETLPPPVEPPAPVPEPAAAPLASASAPAPEAAKAAPAEPKLTASGEARDEPAEPVRPHPMRTHRLDLTSEAESLGRPPRPRRQRRVFEGFMVALILAAVAASAYLRAEDIIALWPAAETALAPYVAQVEVARGWIEDQLGPLRDEYLTN